MTLRAVAPLSISGTNLVGGTPNGVMYLNNLGAITTGSALTFDGTSLGIGIAASSAYGKFAVSNGTNQLGTTFLTNTPTLISVNNAGNSYVDFINDSANQIFKISGSEQMRLTSTGLGIGTSSPGEKLDVNGAIAIGGKKFLSKISGASYWWNNTDATYWVDSTGNTVQMALNASGNLGLGVTPSGWGSGNKAFQFGLLGSVNGRTAGSGAYFSDNVYFTADPYPAANGKYIGTGNATTYTQQFGQHQWYTAPSGTAGNAISFTQAMTLDASGNLGLGVTPSGWNTNNKALQLPGGALFGYTNGTDNNQTILTGNAFVGAGGFAYVNSDSASYYRQYGGTHAWFTAPSGTAGNPITFTQAMTLDANGNLLVGTTTAGGVGLSLYATAGSIQTIFNNAQTAFTANSFRYNGTQIGSISTSTTATAYNTSSDYRLKENIQPMTGALAKVASLKPCTYTWKADGSAGEGFIAHELAEVVPQCVVGEKDAVDEEGKPVYQGIDTSFLVATLTAAIQELKAEFDAYKAAHP